MSDWEMKGVRAESAAGEATNEMINNSNKLY